MVFGTTFGGGRPVRLSEETRRFAAESLSGKYGDEAMRTPWVSLDDIAGFEDMEEYDKYAPLRVTACEYVCGAATLGAAMEHVVPAFRGGKPVFTSVSHLTCGFDRAVREGLDEYGRRIGERMRAGAGRDGGDGSHGPGAETRTTDD